MSTRKVAQYASHIRSCARKVGHESRREAAVALAALEARGETGKRVYRCLACKQYHVGTPPGLRRR